MLPLLSSDINHTHAAHELINTKPSARRRILQEFQIVHDCNFLCIIFVCNTFILDPSICVCMGFMDRGSFNRIYKQIVPIDIDTAGKVKLAMVPATKRPLLGTSGKIWGRERPPERLFSTPFVPAGWVAPTLRLG